MSVNSTGGNKKLIVARLTFVNMLCIISGNCIKQSAFELKTMTVLFLKTHLECPL